MTPARRAEILQFIRRYGSGNGWTGTVGTACAMIHELLQYIDRLESQCQHTPDDLPSIKSPPFSGDIPTE